MVRVGPRLPVFRKRSRSVEDEPQCRERRDQGSWARNNRRDHQDVVRKVNGADVRRLAKAERDAEVVTFTLNEGDEYPGPWRLAVKSQRHVHRLCDQAMDI